MLKLKKHQLLFILIVLLSIFLRFYKLGSIPAGFHHDEVSQAYNSFAIGTTGHDRYGEYFPILFRSFGSYQPPVYTYLSPIPILLFGNTVFAARFLSALSGVIIVIFTYLIVLELTKEKYKYNLSLIAALIVAISPWAIQFSRRVVEGNLGLSIFLISLFLFIRSLKTPKVLPWAAFIMGISTQAYYSERIASTIFIPIFLAVFWKYYFKYKRLVFFALFLFGLTQLPHLWILTTGAYARRFAQVSYFNNDPGDLPRALYLILEFTKHFLSYISPRNLFSDTGVDLGRVSPDLGVFYSWLFIPFLVGIVNFLKQAKSLFFKLLLMLAPISLVSASLTGDVFYPLRILEFLWIVSIAISLGILVILNAVRNKTLGFVIFGILIIYSLIAFYISHAVLLKYETQEYMADSYIKLNEYLKKYDDKKIIIDSGRDFAIGVRIAYFRKFDAGKMASILKPQLTSDYYSSEVSLREVYKIDNILVRPLIWEEDPCQKNTILIGDSLAISEKQAKDHDLTEVFDVKTSDKKIVLKAYSTNQDLNCKPNLLGS